MHIEFARELQHRLLQGRLNLTSTERAMLWRAQTGTWLQQVDLVPVEVQPLIHEAVDLIQRAAFMVENEMEASLAFGQITHRLESIADHIADWS